MITDIETDAVKGVLQAKGWLFDDKTGLYSVVRDLPELKRRRVFALSLEWHLESFDVDYRGNVISGVTHKRFRSYSNIICFLNSESHRAKLNIADDDKKKIAGGAGWQWDQSKENQNRNG